MMFWDDAGWYTAGVHFSIKAARLDIISLGEERLMDDIIRSACGYIGALGGDVRAGTHLHDLIADDIGKLQLLGHDNIAEHVDSLRVGISLLTVTMAARNVELLRSRNRARAACVVFATAVVGCITYILTRM